MNLSYHLHDKKEAQRDKDADFWGFPHTSNIVLSDALGGPRLVVH